ncbi:MAG: UDP-glucose/GDP-mannose dehydrogenase family protein [Gammaproteobacteria bacterium]|nr:UDP-glucose/GDP-mannose dehydrogenase family protein [Gammaproteobacteria bacterium]
MRVTVVGTGYVGLVSGTCLADVGNDVLCIDSDEKKIAGLRDGEIPIFEPGLEELVQRNTSAGRLRFSTDLAEGVTHGEVVFIAVGTPPDEDGAADLQHVLAVAHGIGTVLEDYRVVVNKSTVPVGTADKVKNAIQKALTSRNQEVDFSVVSNPEFLKEGAAIEDFLKPDRIVVGIADERSKEIMRELYAPFNRNHERLLFMDIRSAELTKYAANAMLATKISFMNELANIAERVGADIETVRLGIGSDPRIGYHFIYPGCGYGGSCFPKDVKALAHTATKNAYEARLLNAVEAVNEDQKASLLGKVCDHFGQDLSGLNFGVWGLSFKPNTDDMREAPSLTVISGLLGRGAMVLGYDPVAGPEAQRHFENDKGFSLAEDMYGASENSDALILLTEWKEFRAPDMGRLLSNLRTPVIFDGRNVFDPAVMKRLGARYYSIGRRPVG